MIERIEPIREVAVQLRSDFEHGLVTDEEILEAAIAYDEVYSIRDHKDRARLTDEEVLKFYQVGVRKWLVRKNIVRPEQFPRGYCNESTLVLRRRIEAADLLGDNRAEIIYGGCGEDEPILDASRYWNKIHTFLGIGHTTLGRDTIVDITGDQFREVSEAVYIGPLVDPWTRDPRIELWEI
jgi:hypothetical protein